MTNNTNNDVLSANLKDYKLRAVYRLDFAIELKKRGHTDVFTRRNPQKPWLTCWYFIETESFLADLQELMEGSKNGNR